MKKLFVTVPIIIILASVIAATLALMEIKPDSSHIASVKKLEYYNKPTLVHIHDYFTLDWKIENRTLINLFGKEMFTTMVGSSGSGAIVSPDGFIVANAHTVDTTRKSDDEITKLSFLQFCNIISKEYNIKLSENDIHTLADNCSHGQITRFLKVVLSNGEIFSGELKSFGSADLKGKDMALIKIGGNNLPTLTFSDSDIVSPDDSICMLGYTGRRASSSPASGYSLDVSITTGKISAIDKNSSTDAPVFQLNLISHDVNSGSPVIKEDGSVIGLTSFKVDTRQSNKTLFAIPSNTIKKFIEQSGGKNEAGEADKLYRQGLELYWSGYYVDALVKFEEIQKLSASNQEVKKLVSECRAKSGQSRILWSNYSSTFMIVDLSAGLLIIILLVISLTGIINKRAIPELNKNTSCMTDGEVIDVNK